VRKEEVAQKKELSASGTKIQLGSECHPGSIGFVYVEFEVTDNAMAGMIDINPKMIFHKYILGGGEKKPGRE
jgi:hypothetical protein